MEQSFSLEFNPMMNVKSVKEYEEEIEKLKAENFELKARLTHNSSGGNIPKILYEQSEQFSRLEQVRAELARQNEELHRNLSQVLQEKAELEHRYKNDVVANNEKMGLLEQENKRLLIRLEKSNKDVGEVERLKALLRESEKLNSDYKEYIQNEEKKAEQERFENARQIEALNTHIAESKRDFERAIAEKNTEILNVRKTLEGEINRNKSNILVISDLKNTLSNEIRERERLKEENMKLREAVEQSKGLKLYFERQQKEGQIYLAGMEKLRKILHGKLSETQKRVNGLAEKLSVVLSFASLSSDNTEFLKKAKISTLSVDRIVSELRAALSDSYKKVESLRRETKDAALFSENARRRNAERTRKILEDFKIQFSAAKNELLECRKYLIKKASENKDLKNENALLRREVSNLQKSARTRPVSAGNYNPLRL